MRAIWSTRQPGHHGPAMKKALWASSRSSRPKHGSDQTAGDITTDQSAVKKWQLKYGDVNIFLSLVILYTPKKKRILGHPLLERDNVANNRDDPTIKIIVGPRASRQAAPAVILAGAVVWTLAGALLLLKAASARFSADKDPGVVCGWITQARFAEPLFIGLINAGYQWVFPISSNNGCCWQESEAELKAFPVALQVQVCFRSHPHEVLLGRGCCRGDGRACSWCSLGRSSPVLRPRPPPPWAAREYGAFFFFWQRAINVCFVCIV